MKKILFTILIGLLSFITFSQNKITTELKAKYESAKYDQIIIEHSDKVDKYPAKEITINDERKKHNKNSI